MKSIFVALALVVTASPAFASLDSLDCTTLMTGSGRFVTIEGVAPTYKVTVLSINGKVSSDYTVASESGVNMGFEIVLHRNSGTLPATLKLDYNAVTPLYTLKGFPEAIVFDATRCK